jgi:hypothetical protein
VDAALVVQIDEMLASDKITVNEFRELLLQLICYSVTGRRIVQ